MGDRKDARRLASQKMSEARQWWENAELAAHRYRCWALVMVASTRQYSEEPKCSLRGHPGLKRMIDVAHDQMLIAAQTMESAVRAAQGCTIMARIYYEEAEERVNSLEERMSRIEIEENERDHR